MSRRLTTQEIIIQFKSVHGDRFDYTLVEYVNAKSKVNIICSLHGAFLQSPDKHKRGDGCPKCSGKGKNTEQILKEFSSIYNDKYDYSLVKYINTSTKVIIICNVHGEFLKSPEKHKAGQGCPTCSEIERVIKRQTPIKKLLIQFENAHGKKYDYSNMVYKGTDRKIIIICSEHGGFEQSPGKHISGRGCPKCVGKNWTYEEYVIYFNKIHNNEFEYPRFKTKGVNREIEIICSKHGVFYQTIDSHKQGRGCLLCGIEINADKKRIPQKVILERFRTVHGDKYGYSKVNYRGMDHKVIIECKVHGQFNQNPTNHLMGKGCSKCIGRGLLIEEFIARFNEVHGNRYDYSKVKFSKVKDKIDIICTIHGEFVQTADSHYQGNGCPKCSGQGFSKKEIVSRFGEVHGERYDYTKVRFSSVKDKVSIGCKTHGIFKQTVESHYRGVGCPLCVLTPQSKQELQINFELQLFFSQIDPKGFKTRIEGKLWTIDIYIPELNLGIEFDGSYWHKEKQDLDKMKTIRLRDQGFKVVRIREEPLNKLFENDIISKRPFEPKVVVNDVLTYILRGFDISDSKTNEIKKYITLKRLRNTEGLNLYIDSVMNEKLERKMRNH